MRRAVVFVVVAALAGLAAPAGAQTVSAGTCTVSGGVSVTPGLSLTPTQGTYLFTSDTTLSCIGVIGSQAVAGSGAVTSPGRYGYPGTISYQLQGGDTCVLGSGHGTFSADVPTVLGPLLHVVGDYDFIRVGTLVIINGNANGFPLAGFFQFTPDLGQDCFLTPVNRANVTGQAFVGGVA